MNLELAPFEIVFVVAGFAAAAIAYATVAALAIAAHPGSRPASWLVIALAGSSLWAAVIAGAIANRGALAPWLLDLDAAHSLLWLLFLASVLRHAAAEAGGRSPARVLVAAGIGLWAVTALANNPALGTRLFTLSVGSELLSLLAMSLLGLFALEQVYRNAGYEQRRILTPLCVVIGILFAVDIFVYSQAVLLNGIDPIWWSTRAYLNVGIAPVILYVIKRQPEWDQRLFVSRQVVFYTASLLGAGLYLLAMALAGVVIARSAGAWGGILQTVFFLAAGIALAFTLFSTRLKRRLKVFIAKHFYRNRYDYREEWLKLVSTLSMGDGMGLPERCIKALADIIGSPCGVLWLSDGPGTPYVAFAAWETEIPNDAFPADHVLIKFLDETRWIVDTQEYRDAPEKYSNVFDSAPELVADAAIIVPLLLDRQLIGIVRLERPSGLGALGFEDHDILKSAGRQVAVFFAQQVSQKKLTEVQQFEAFNKLSTFLMHDLKNAIAQQELVVANAQRFRDRPEFIDDAVATIRSSVERMRKVLDQVRSAAEHRPASTRADVSKVLGEVGASCADRAPAPAVEILTAPAWVRMDKDKLAAVLTHLIRNAQDATSSDGRVSATLAEGHDELTITVSDTGCGMDKTFIRERLFRPFDTTKGAKGMGIGAFQVRDTIRAAGGDVEVDSEPGVGTTFRLRIPRASAAEGLRAGEPAA